MEKASAPAQSITDRHYRDARLAPHAPMQEITPTGLMGALARFTLSIKGMHVITPASHPELYAEFERMSRQAGLPTPTLLLADSPKANAAALSPQQILITSTLMQHVSLEEATAILGHELGHATHHRKHTFMRLAGGIGFSALGEMTLGSALLRLAPHEPGTALSWPKWITRAVMRLTGLLSGMAVGAKLGVRPAELESDALGAAYSGDPEALISGLRKLHPAQPSLRYRIMHMLSGYPTLEERADNIERIFSLRQAPASPTTTDLSVMPLPGNEIQQASPLGMVATLPERQLH